MATPSPAPKHDWHPVHAELQAQRCDGWLVFDFRNNNPVLARILGTRAHLTRRVYWFLPRNAEPRVLCHRIDQDAFVKLGIEHTTYATWNELPAKIRELVGTSRRVAMEYSPGGALPVASIVDAGAIEAIRALGLEIVSSADLVQLFAARWLDAGLASHQIASTHAGEIMTGAFAFISQRLRSAGVCQEREAQKWITDQFAARKLSYPDDPIVSVNANSGIPHYAPDDTRSSPIKPGDWVLIDLWCRTGGDATIYADITQTGYCGDRVPDEHRRVFDTVREARDASLHAAQAGWKAGNVVHGYELDNAARLVISRAGYADFIKHRTGHSLSPGALVHGIGMNLDNMETHDTRRMLPGTGFTIEPGIYLPGFGVRNEINVYVDPSRGPIVTSATQDQPHLILC